ncbi:M57 family metalloprotease, partial [Aquimarina aggregata]|uniref:M57 family metalloprotease n=2 Tax=Aquimarina TaxID=290174 RepID=UPI00249310D6
MKKTVKNVLILNSLFLLLIGCSNDDKVLENENLLQNDPVLQTIEKWGFSKDDIKDLGDYYLVDGDIVFYKDEKYLSPDSPSTKQRQHPNSVTISNINVFINPGMNINWRNASTQAINRWNAVNSTLNLIVTTVPANAHIQIMYDSQDPAVNLGSSTFGRGTFPTANGLPGRTIWVNPDFDSPRFCGRAITQNMRITNVQHEIGHNVGITHTNQSFGSLIPGTPNTDSQSVMNGGQACTIDNFSAGDITAIQFLFPVPLPFRNGAEWLNGPFNYSAYQFEVGDVNNDGRDDVVGIRKDDERVVVWLSNGNGFRSGAEWLNGPFNYSAYQFEVGDVNNDGREDIIGIRKDDERVVVWLSNGNGFRSGAEWLNGPFNYSAYQFEVGDVNNDGREDVIGIRKDDERVVVWLS